MMENCFPFVNALNTYAEYGPKLMLLHVTMLDEVGQTVGSSVLKKHLQSSFSNRYAS